MKILKFSLLTGLLLKQNVFCMEKKEKSGYEQFLEYKNKNNAILKHIIFRGNEFIAENFIGFNISIKTIENEIKDITVTRFYLNGFDNNNRINLLREIKFDNDKAIIRILDNYGFCCCKNVLLNTEKNAEIVMFNLQNVIENSQKK